MITTTIFKNLKAIMFLVTIMTFLPYQMNAQRLGHAASRGGGHSISRPATRPAARPASRPASRQTARPSTNNRTINGGHQKATTRPAASKRPVNKATTTRPNTKNKVTNVGNKNTNIKGGNKIDNSKRNINIDNSKNININRNNTRVNVSSRHYSRPPHRYGGHAYYCHRPYYYHPYRPFYWGPVWHPWGYFVATLATTAVIVSIENQKYHYDQGVYYVAADGGYTVVQAPIGATVQTLPKEAEEVKVSETTNNYYYGGAYYDKTDEGYTVVPATAGTIVPNLPEGGEEVKIGDITYVQFGETYYQPIQVDGDDMYEIVEVKAD